VQWATQTDLKLEKTNLMLTMQCTRFKISDQLLDQAQNSDITKVHGI